VVTVIEVLWQFRLMILKPKSPVYFTCEICRVCFSLAPVWSSFFSMITHHFSSVSFSSNDAVFQNLFTVVQIVSVYRATKSWNFLPESCPYFSFRSTFHLGIVHEHSLFQCVSCTWHFDTGSNLTEWQLIVQVKYSSRC